MIPIKYISLQLLDADAAVDLEDTKGKTPAKLALLTKHLPTLELLLRHGASAHRAAMLPESVPGVPWTEDEKNRIRAIEEVDKL